MSDRCDVCGRPWWTDETPVEMPEMAHCASGPKYRDVHCYIVGYERSQTALRGVRAAVLSYDTGRTPWAHDLLGLIDHAIAAEAPQAPKHD